MTLKVIHSPSLLQAIGDVGKQRLFISDLLLLNETLTSDATRNGDAENARPENDGQRKLGYWKTTDWKMAEEKQPAGRRAHKGVHCEL